jgi:hypothetical protein
MTAGWTVAGGATVTSGSMVAGGTTMAGRMGLAAALPESLRVEVSAIGDLRCAMCLVGCRPPVNRLTGAMTLAMFRSLVDEVPGLRELVLQGIGEPLLAPNLVDMIRYAKARGVRVAVDTNATLLYRDRAEELVEAGLDRLYVSLDGADPQGFEGVPDGAHFGPVLENLAGLVAARRAAQRGTPAVLVLFVATPQNIAQLPDMVALLGGIGVGEVRVRHASSRLARLDPEGVLYQEPPFVEGMLRAPVEQPGPLDPVRAAKVFAEARLAAEEYGLAVTLPDPDPDAQADVDDTADAVYVTSDGVVQTCCRVAAGRRSRDAIR